VSAAVLPSLTVPVPAVWESIQALVRFARFASGADGYAFFEFDHERNAFLLLDRGGVQSGGVQAAEPQSNGSGSWVISRDGVTIGSFPLRAENQLAAQLDFVFLGHAIDKSTLHTLTRMAQVIEAVYRLPRSTARLVEKIGSLEIELASIKISERTLGLLVDGTPNSDSVDAVVRHVENVLERRPASIALKQLLPELENRVADRKLMVKAKQFLQRRDGLSEEQAYLNLRNRSRARRQKLRDVAREIMD